MAAKKIVNVGHGEAGGCCYHRLPGFSLLELVMVLAVISVLLTLAVPAYQQYVQRAHRAEAIRIMLAFADCQERVRADSGFYDTSRCGGNLANGSYEFRIEPFAVTASLKFTIIAEPHDGGYDACGELSLNQAGTRGISGEWLRSGKCWSGL